MDGSGNVGTIFDIEWERKKLFGCMRIPPDFMGFADTSGTLQAATPLANQSIRYARGVRSLQHAEILGVVTLLEIDLSMKGLDPHDPKNEFSVHMHPPSYLEEKEQAEAAKIKAETIDIMLEMGEKMGIDRQRWFQHVAEVAGLPEELILSADVKKPEGRKERLSTRIARWHTTQLMLLEAHLPSTVRSRDYPLRMGLSIPKAGGGGYEHVGIFGGYSGERVLKTINEAVVTYDESRKAMSATASEG